MNSITLQYIRDVLEPFATAKEYNPSESVHRHTSRTINVKGNELDDIRELYDCVVADLEKINDAR